MADPKIRIIFDLTHDQWARLEGVLEQTIDEMKDDVDPDEESIEFLDYIASRIYKRRTHEIVHTV
jgi:hypothetical protein